MNLVMSTFFLSITHIFKIMSLSSTENSENKIDLKTFLKTFLLMGEETTPIMKIKN